MNQNGAKILVIDDERGIRDLLCFALGDVGYSVETAQNGEEGIRKSAACEFNVVITDFKMPGMDGLAVIREIKQICPKTEVILVTGYSMDDTPVQSMSAGAFGFMKKPYNINDIISAVSEAVEKYFKA